MPPFWKRSTARKHLPSRCLNSMLKLREGYPNLLTLDSAINSTRRANFGNASKVQGRYDRPRDTDPREGHHCLTLLKACALNQYHCAHILSIAVELAVLKLLLFFILFSKIPVLGLSDVERREGYRPPGNAMLCGIIWLTFDAEFGKCTKSLPLPRFPISHFPLFSRLGLTRASM